MQLACIFNNVEAQEWQNLDEIFIETKKNLPKIVVGERRKCMLKFRENPFIFSPRRAAKMLKMREKDARFQPTARQSLAKEGQKSIP